MIYIIGYPNFDTKPKLYDTERQKMRMLSYKSFCKESKRGNILGVDKSCNFKNEKIDDLFIYGKYKYYIKGNIILVYSIINQLVKIYDITLFGNYSGNYCSLKFNKGEVSLYIMDYNSIRRLMYAKTYDATFVREMKMTDREFMEKHKSIVYKYLLVKEK